MKAYQALAATLVDHGVDTVFGLMGDANMQFVAHYRGELHQRFIGATHEAGAVAAADGFNRISRRLGVVSVTHGPGLTNTVTALTEATRNKSQILLITGDTPAVRTWTQAIDIAAVVAPTGAGYERVYHAESVVEDVRRAIHRVRTEGRPIVLNFPFDLMKGEAEEPIGSRAEIIRAGALRPDAAALEGALGIIAGAQRPVVLAGRGAALSNAREELLELADVLGCPVATTLLGRDLFDGHPLNLGICGSLASTLATEVLMASDCLIVFGAGLNRYTTYVGELARGKRIVQVDVDLRDVGLYTPVNEAIEGDAAAVARALSDELRRAGLKGTGWGNRYAERIAQWRPADGFVDQSAHGTVDTRSALIRLNEILPADRNVVTDVGRFITSAWRYLHVPYPTRFTHTSTFGSIGLGLGAAIGAAVGDSSRLTVGVMGDGGFMMTAGELSTAVRHRIAVLVVVLNDGAYGAEYTKLRNYGDDPDFSLVDWPDIGDLARVMGCATLTVRKLEDMDEIPRVLEDLNGPGLIDVRLDPHLDVGHW